MYYLIDNTFHVDKNKYFIYDREKDRAYRDSVIKHHIASFNDSLTLFRALEDRGGRGGCPISPVDMGDAR